MNLLLVNDDGVFAPGIRALSLAGRAAGHRVLVCAPDRERSAASHSATLNRPLRAREVEVPGAEIAWAVDGTPADCAHLGLWLAARYGAPADVAVSGINAGMNLGGACVYSGTVGAAMEASMHGAIALAASLSYRDYQTREHDFSAAARVAVKVAEWAASHPLPRGVLYNLNVPEGPFEAIRGMRAARLTPLFMADAEYAALEDDEGPCYRYTYVPEKLPEDIAYDMPCVSAGFATLTKLTWDMRLDADDAELNEITL